MAYLVAPPINWTPPPLPNNVALVIPRTIIPITPPPFSGGGGGGTKSSGFVA